MTKVPESCRLDARSPAIASVALALGLAYGGQLLLSGLDSRHAVKQAVAGGMLVAGALLFGAAMRHVRDPFARLEFPRASTPAFASATRPSSRWLVIAVGLGAGATAAFASFGESAWVVVGWLGGVAALLFAHIRSLRIRRPRIPPAQRPYLRRLSGLLILALVTRTYHSTTLPYNVDGDFASVGLIARELAAGQRQIFAYDGWAGLPILGYLPSAVPMTLFGSGLGALNASGVVEGLLIVLGVYLLGRDLFHPRVGLLAAALLTISYTHLAASRQSCYIDPVLFLLYALYFLLIGLCEYRGWALIASGALTALCIQMYFSGRLILLILGFLLVYAVLFNRPWLRPRWRAVGLWVLAFVITVGPMWLVFLRDSHGLMSRAREVFILSPEIIRHEQGVYQTNSLAGIMLQQARRAALLFHYYPDTGTQFALGVPFLDPFTAPLFALGLGYALFRCRSVGLALLLAWTGLSVVFGAFLTSNPPFWPRLMVLLPPTALLAALALDKLYDLIKLPQRGRGIALVPPVALVLLLAFVGVQNWRTYVAAKGSWATPRTRIARYLAGQSPAPTAYLVSSEYSWRDREFDFLVPGRFAGDLTPEQVEHSALPADATLLILSRDQHELLTCLQQRYGAASTEAHPGNTPGEIGFYVFRRP